MSALEKMVNLSLFYLLLSQTCWILLFWIAISLRKRLQRHVPGKKDSQEEIVVGFFHPYCNAGGGGERVLWCAINSIQKKYPNAKCVVYTGDCDVNGDQILDKVKNTFNIKVQRFVEFRHLRTRFLVEAKYYPVFTLLGQSVGSIILGLEAAIRRPPDIFIDTMGYAFTLPIFKYLAGSETACYVHYPTISSDMLSLVECRNDSFNNRRVIAASRLLTSLKLFYYRAFAHAYGMAGARARVVMVNSSWTRGHVDELWRVPTHKIFPPCDVAGSLSIPLKRLPCNDGKKLIVSIAQFRPEKNHALQIRSFAKFLSRLDASERDGYCLVLAGGCRNHGDRYRVEKLRELADELGLSAQVDVQTNISFEQLRHLLSCAHVGMHTMKNEHFGIGVVEFQAAGVIVLAHNTGGPKMDIVQAIRGEELSGYLASDEDGYADALIDVFTRKSDAQLDEMRLMARESCDRFSEQCFQTQFQNSTAELFAPDAAK